MGERQAEQLRAELTEQKKANQAATAERDQVRAELATVKAKAEAADQAHQEQRKTAEREAQRAAERIRHPDQEQHRQGRNDRQRHREGTQARGVKHRIQADQGERASEHAQHRGIA